MLPSRFMQSVYPQYSDDDTEKEVSLQAAGLVYNDIEDRHVLLEWPNHDSETNGLITQIVQLTGQAGNFAYYSPLANVQDEKSRYNNQFFSLGTFTRAQRDRILELAQAVKFERKSTVNNCHAWTHDLLLAMVDDGLLDQNKVTEIEGMVPLRKRVPEHS